MRLLANVIRCARKTGFTILLLVGTFTLGAAVGFAASPNSETIQATYTQAGKTISITLIIYNYSTPSDLQVLSQAFEEGQDRGLATALSKTKAAGHCSITGALSYDVAFIQMVVTPTGRKITFVTSRPHQFDEVDPGAQSQSFDLAIGQFDLNDIDNTKSTGFLYPASKLVIDKQGMFHYDLAGNPWSLVNVLDSKTASDETLALGPGN
ncbi:MAG TPA: hypothetical protein VGE85_09235 [Terracidiphilus sp.]|jgi:hypothetical protein